LEVESWPTLNEDARRVKTLSINAHRTIIDR